MISRLELHVTHACNLACESCSHYSNHGHKGDLALDMAAEWLAAWGARVTAEHFVLLGGEPTIHPDLGAFVPLVRRHFPGARISIITNGFFLARHPALGQIVADDGNARIELSVHADDPDYLKHVLPAIGLLHQWQKQLGTPIDIGKSYRHWHRRYWGEGAAMLPFDDGDARASWADCAARDCVQLHEGAIWKCPQIAYLAQQHAKVGLPDAWAPYLGYVPLAPTASDADLTAFLAREDEAICSMCPAQRRIFAPGNPMRGAARKVRAAV
ncbi:MAG: hypothetical protein RLZZ58_1797 [Pseudomonadota bacterium]|jgi:hypothetical protein